jgi:hypothetical protein
MKLFAFEKRWGRAAFSGMYPAGAHPRIQGDIDTMDVPAYLDELWDILPLKPAMGVRVTLWILGLAPIFVLGRFATLWQLGATEREQTVVKLLASPTYVVRQLVLLMKALAALLFLSSPSVRDQILDRVPAGEDVSTSGEREKAGALVPAAALVRPAAAVGGVR